MRDSIQAVVMLPTRVNVLSSGLPLFETTPIIDLFLYAAIERNLSAVV